VGDWEGRLWSGIARPTEVNGGQEKFSTSGEYWSVNRNWWILMSSASAYEGVKKGLHREPGVQRPLDRAKR